MNFSTYTQQSLPKIENCHLKCPNPKCLKCAANSEIDQEMVDFFAIMLEGKSVSGGLRVVAKGYGVPNQSRKGSK